MSEHLNIGLPEQISIKNNYDSIEITRQWPRFQPFTMALGAVYLIYHCVTKYTGTENVDIPNLLYLLVFIILMTYFSLAGLLNKTYIMVTKKNVEIRHRPIPWVGNKIIDASEIKQLYAKERRIKNNRLKYEVHVITHSGEDTKLLRLLDSSKQALYIEQEVEKYLSIKNVSVHEELG
ncbi:hypothetical protein RGQ13_18465 [Thalassotalea psychrophila]|uniref:DUF304 domain-containing protein n=1 Tax=Thalassotalea psychrophila TaxID=3065647 RepID=A0ABY9TWC8_9GAMM|nr:hypothetical protein RGQ13_18465 [Colwelliaceae bacterium SQ149]